MIYAIVGILLIAFIAFVVLSAKAWHWVNIVFLSLCFLTAVGVVYAAAKVLDARRDVMLQVQKSEKDLENLKNQIEQTVYGAGMSFEYDPQSLRGLSRQLALAREGRGRVWKNGAIESDGEIRIFKFDGERVLNPEKPNALKSMTMFVFADRDFQEELYPVLFVGIMKVIEEAPDALVLEPVFIADFQEYRTPTNSWTLFEKPPSDQRDAYIRDTGIVLKEDDSSLNDKLTEYRQLLIEQYIPAEAFGLDLADDASARKYEGIIDRVMFDGLPLVKIETWIASQSDRYSSRFDPSNEEIFVKYQFNEKSTRQYQVNASGNIETDGQFNKNGQAINPALYAGRNVEYKVEFQKGDVIFIDQLTADGYQRGEEPVPPFSSIEPVTEISRVYQRQLKDYPYLLRKFDREIRDYTAEIARIEENNKRSQFAIAESGKQLQERQTQTDLLQQDIQKFEVDLQLVNGFLDQTRDRSLAIKSSIKQMETDIRSKHRQIKATANAFKGGTPVFGAPASGVPFDDGFSAPIMGQPIPTGQSFPVGQEIPLGQPIPTGQPIYPSPILSAPIDDIQSMAPGQ